MVLAGGFLPLCFAYINYQDLETLKSPSFIKVWGQLYAGLRTNSTIHMLYFLVFALRRALFTYISFYLEEPSIQLIWLFLLNIMMAIYIAHTRSLERSL